MRVEYVHLDAFSYASLSGFTTLFAVFLEFLVLAMMVRALFKEGERYALLLGWSALSFILTLAGTVLKLPLHVALWASLVLLLAAPLRALRQLRPRRLTVLCFVLCGVLLAMAGCITIVGTDTYWFWLSNASFIHDFDHFPTAANTAPTVDFNQDLTQAGPIHLWYSAFPFNLQYLLFGVGRILPYFPETAMIAANALLLIWFTSVVVGKAAAAAPEAESRFDTVFLAALGVISLIAFNPTLMVLTSLGDLSTGIVLAATIFSICDRRALIHSGTAGAPPVGPLATGMLLALLVNIKQANLALAGLAVIWALIYDPALRNGSTSRRLRALAAMLVPPLLAYAAWRYYVFANLPPSAENQIAPISQWPIGLLGSTLWHMAEAIFRKLGYTLLLLLAAVTLFRARRRPSATVNAVAASLFLFLGYNAFLAFIYLVRFDGFAQAVWRFNTQLGPLLVGSLLIHYWGFLQDVFKTRSGTVQASLAGLAVAICLLFPIAFPSNFRSDFKSEAKEHAIVRDIKQDLPEDAALGVIYYRAENKHQFGGELAYQRLLLTISFRLQAPRRSDVTFKVVDTFRPQTLPDHVLVFCDTQGVSAAFGLPPGHDESVLLARQGQAWRVERSWPYHFGSCRG
jgi:hypothetical protein